MSAQRLYQGPVAEALVQAQVDIGRLEAEVVHLTRSVDELKKSNAKMGETLEQIQRTLSEAKGGWRTMMWMGGAAASIGGVISWAATHITWRG
jgi:prefoldin subunit 5